MAMEQSGCYALSLARVAMAIPARPKPAQDSTIDKGAASIEYGFTPIKKAASDAGRTG